MTKPTGLPRRPRYPTWFSWAALETFVGHIGRDQRNGYSRNGAAEDLCPSWYVAELAHTSTRQIVRWKLRGTIPEPFADRIAASLGVHPHFIWGAEYEQWIPDCPTSQEASA